MISRNVYKVVLFIFLLISLIATNRTNAQDFNCADCHETSIEKSVHKTAIDCQGCHQDVIDEEHIEKGVAKVSCAACHEDIASSMKNDIHVRLKQKVKNPPNCVTCHGNHEIQKPPTQNSLKIKEYCSKCHTSIGLAKNYHSVSADQKSCYSCHNNINVKIALPSSVHKNLVCSDCHTGSRFQQKHKKENVKTKIADCSTCHTDIAKIHRESIHGIALLEGIDDAANCWDCHGSHEVKFVKNESSRVHPKNLATTCGTCHNDSKMVEKYGLSSKNPGGLYAHSIHGVLVKEGRTDAPNCSTCHGTHDIKNKVQPNSKISTFNIPTMCGECHKEISEEFEQSIHWIRAKKGVRESPVCTDCHNEHDIQSVNRLTDKTAERQLQQRTCIGCHENPIIANKFGAAGSVAKKFEDSYHGLAVMRGDKDAAYCVDCHNVHKILPKNHPESSVHENNVTTTCQKCHEGAGEVFAKSYSHTTLDEKAATIEDWVSTIYFWMIVAIVGGMIAHNLLIFVYEIRKKRKHLSNEITIPRFTKNEVIQHFILLTSFITLAITGFALKYHQSWWADLLLNMGMSEPVRQYIHRVAAVVMIAGGIYHIFYLMFTPRGRDVLLNLLPKLHDATDAYYSILYYLKLRKDKPKYDKYDYTEKAEYWALIWGTIVMGVTGFILWFPTVVGDWAPTWLIKVSELIHFYEAILATLAILVWHWFFVIFHPHEYPMSLTWIDGQMSLKTYRHHHERHFRRVLLEWTEHKNGNRDLKKVSNTTLLFTKTLTDKGLDPEAIFQSELNNDPELRAWLDDKINPKQENQ
ncbi:MAG: cytochrome c3 family protein [Melioribacteraceae bacterium]|nr:cytochrome c3 family protein [Melioribacteraceae bacterium]